MGKQSKTVIGCFSFVCLLRSQIFSIPLTNIQGSFLGGMWMNVPGSFNFLSKLWQQKTHSSYFLDVSGLGSSFANAKLKVIYEISNTLSLQMSYTFPLRPSTPPSLHPSALASPSSVQHEWIIFISKRTGHHLQYFEWQENISGKKPCQSGTVESQRPARWYLQTSSLAKHTCHLLTLLFFLCHRKYFHSCWAPEHKRNPFLCKWLNWGHRYVSISKKRELTAFGLFNSSDDKGFLALSLCMWTLYWDHSGTALYRCSILVGGGGRGTGTTIHSCGPSPHPSTLSFFWSVSNL